jgi:hypothetical protein
MIKLEKYIDRYPAKMFGELADSITAKYTSGATSLLDPFCGSSTVLESAAKIGIKTCGFDINPFAVLLSSVKLNGFNYNEAIKVCCELIEKSKSSKTIEPVKWENIHYWFTPSTLDKFQKLRFQCKKINLSRNREGRAILLSLALSVRLCSKADQRSPKPFISKRAIHERSRKHYDPYKYIIKILQHLDKKYGKNNYKSNIYLKNILDIKSIGNKKYSHIITSPPYINAQDYFRNHKLELYILEGLIPFNIKKVRSKMIGRENNFSINSKVDDIIKNNKKFNRIYPKLSNQNKKIIEQYLCDMIKTLINIKRLITKKGKLITICGDNLMNNQRIPTCELLNNLIENSGFRLNDQFKDKIKNRMLPPSRLGHKGLIKQEIISVFNYYGT